MANGGFFLVYRKIWENAMLKDEPFNRGYAWLWLVSEASYDGTDRGQVVVSERQLAKAWQWDKMKVRRFLSELEKSGMITKGCGTESEAGSEAANEAASPRWKTLGSTVVTICNYAKYQSRVAKNEIDEFAKVRQQTRQEARHTLKKDTSTLRSEVSILKEPARDFSNSSLSKQAIAPPTEAEKAEALERYRKRKAEMAEADRKADEIAKAADAARTAKLAASTDHIRRALADLEIRRRNRNDTEH